MPLDFGGRGLFDTSIEERFKGIFDRRKETKSNADAAAGSFVNVDTSYEDLLSIELDVKNDEAVHITFAAELLPVDLGNGVDLRCLRTPGNETIGWPNTHNPIEYEGRRAAGSGIDRPGEGTFTYTIQGKSDNGNGNILEVTLTGFVISNT